MPNRAAPNRAVARRLQRLRVPLGFLCGGLCMWLARPLPLTLAAGGGVALCGLALRAWAAGHIRKNAHLATSGPYAYTRNPLYLGSFLLGLGFAIAGGRIVLGVVFAVFFLSIYLPVMRVEAQTLGELFRDEYTRYAQTVPLFLPRLTPQHNGPAKQPVKFDVNLYLRYREYRAALGLLIVWSVLWIKAVLIK